jgi:hypothetical protein
MDRQASAVTDFILTKGFSKRRTVEGISSKTYENHARQRKKRPVETKRQRTRSGGGRRLFPVADGVPKGTEEQTTDRQNQTKKKTRHGHQTSQGMERERETLILVRLCQTVGHRKNVYYTFLSECSPCLSLCLSKEYRRFVLHNYRKDRKARSTIRRKRDKRL